jgi:hypothetical protein
LDYYIVVQSTERKYIDTEYARPYLTEVVSKSSLKCVNTRQTT